MMMNEVMKELITVQEKNEVQYLELEEKLMHMEEKMFDKELATYHFALVIIFNVPLHIQKQF